MLFCLKIFHNCEIIIHLTKGNRFYFIYWEIQLSDIEMIKKNDHNMKLIWNFDFVLNFLIKIFKNLNDSTFWTFYRTACVQINFWPNAVICIRTLDLPFWNWKRELWATDVWQHRKMFWLKLKNLNDWTFWAFYRIE